MHPASSCERGEGVQEVNMPSKLALGVLAVNGGV
jgi:hypothetical protein